MKYTIFLFFLIPTLVIAQHKTDTISFSKRRMELSLNITNTISNTLGNIRQNNQLVDPYLIGLKFRLNDNIYLRSAFNIRQRNVNESSSQYSEFESTQNARLGVELRESLNRKILIYYGIDIVYNQMNYERTYQNKIGVFTTKSISTGFGGGPLIGFMYCFNKRIALSTEASLYYLNTKTTYTSLNVQNTQNGYTLMPIVPSSLYVIINF